MIARATLVALAAALALGCSNDRDVGPAACDQAQCAPECTALAGGTCDILDADCRRRILDAVICVRGTPGEMPPVRTITEDEYRAELLARRDSGVDAGVPDAGLDDDAGTDPPDGGIAGADPGATEPDFWSAALRLLGLVGDEEDLDSASLDEQVSSIAGFYSSARRNVTLIDRGRPESSEYAQSLLAHEFVHALQDQDVGLAQLADRTFGSVDASYAYGCLIEGDAMLYEDLAFALLQGISVDQRRWDVDLQRRLKYARRGVVSATSPYAAVWHLRYPVGARYLADAWIDAGNHAVQGLYWAPPLATIHWMHGYRAGLERRGQLVRALACNQAMPPSDLSPERDTSMGPFVVFAFIGHALRDDGVYESEALWQHAMQWRQDSMTVFTGDEGETAVSWRIRFEDETLAHTLAERIDTLAELELKAFARGDELEVLASTDAEVLANWRGTNPDACPLQL